LTQIAAGRSGMTPTEEKRWQVIDIAIGCRLA